MQYILMTVLCTTVQLTTVLLHHYQRFPERVWMSECDYMFFRNW